MTFTPRRRLPTAWLALWLLPLAAGCPRPMDDIFFPDTGFGGGGCWFDSTASGLARRLEGDVQLVLTPAEPSRFHFVSAALVSGGTMVEESMSEVEVVMRITPEDEAVAIVVTVQLDCQSEWGDSGTPPQTFSIVPSSLTTEWSLVGGAM